jgi:Flp pilus assembly protein TadG
MVTMRLKIAGLATRFASDTRGGVAIVTALAIPVILGFSALALEYGSALHTKSKNQRTSDIAAFAAAHAYNRDASANATDKEEAARTAAASIATLNGVSSGVTVSFDDPADATTIDVTISEDKPIFLSRLLRPDDSVTVNTRAKVAIGQSGEFTPCILALGDDIKKDGVTFNGASGDYGLEGCDIASNGEIAANGFTQDTKCAAPRFKKSDTCVDETVKGDFKDPLAGFTNWPNDFNFDSVCKSENTGKFPDDLTTEVGKGSNKKLELKEGVLCVTGFERSKAISSDPDGDGSTLIFKEGVDFELKGNESFSIKPSTSGDFEGVGFYLPKSEVTMSGNPDLTINGSSCFGFIAKALTFNGNVTLTTNCDKDDPRLAAGNANSGNRPRLIQ